MRSGNGCAWSGHCQAVQVHPGGFSTRPCPCRFFQYMTFYMIALQLVQFSLAVVADCLPLVST